MFDDGILNIYETIDVAEAGKKPDIRLQEKGKHYFQFEVVGYGRYYTALQVNHKIDANVKIWQDTTISTLDLCVLEDGLQYRIIQIQHFTDDDGLRKSRLSLERLNDEYKYKD